MESGMPEEQLSHFDSCKNLHFNGPRFRNGKNVEANNTEPIFKKKQKSNKMNYLIELKILMEFAAFMRIILNSRRE